jgi:hypothetical protein
MKMLRYTVLGDEALDSLIEKQLASITASVLNELPRENIVALVLGGGYGRGEGGALQSPEGLRPYNDYDLILVYRDLGKARVAETLARINREQGAACGIHVDITPLEESKLATLPATLTWCELQQGHQVLYGSAGALALLGQRKVSDVPKSEWGRLLFNRGSGILFSVWAHQGQSRAILAQESFEEFTTRQVAKAWLSLGDVWLSSRGLYETSVVARERAFRSQQADWPVYAERYLEAIRFKLSPVLLRPQPELIKELAELSALYAVALSEHQASEQRPFVGLYATAKNLAPWRWALSAPWRYPRERLKRALAAELRGDVLERKRLVGSPADYLKLWGRYG